MRAKRIGSVGIGIALVIALSLTGCAGVSSPSPEPLTITKDLAGRQYSWSWSLVSGSTDADPLVVGLERRPDREPTIQAILYQRGDHVQRVSDLPTTPIGTPYAVKAVGRGRGAVIVGATLDQANAAVHTFMLTSADRQVWRAVPLSEDLGVVPAAAAADDNTIYAAQGRSAWRVTEQGGVTALTPPDLREDEQITDLALSGGRLWALAHGREGVQARLTSSSDDGTTWGAPEIVAGESSPVTPSGLLVDGSRIVVSGHCGHPSEPPRACLAIREGGSWSREEPFRNSNGFRLVAPTLNAGGGTLTAATSSKLSEGWPAERSPTGAWTGSRADLVGSSVGTVLAVGAGTSGVGFLAVVRNDESTRLVWRGTAAADAKDQVETIIGGSAMSSWIRAPGSTWGPRSQLLEVHPTVTPTGSGGAYFVAPSSSPVSINGSTVTSDEWRPALGRSKDAVVAETSGDKTVIAGSETPSNRTDLGSVHVYLSEASGARREVATELAPRFRNQMATALVSGREWVLATSPPVSSLADESSRLFRSDDGVTWLETPGPSMEAGATNRIDRICLLPDGGLVAVGKVAPAAEMAVWRRQGNSWTRLAVPDKHKPTGSCASSGDGVFIPGEGPRGAVLWRLRDAQLEPLNVDWPAGAEVHGAVSVAGGVAAAGVADLKGVRVPTLWFSRDGGEWAAVRLAAGAGGDAFLAVMQKDNGVVVLSTAPDGISGWMVRPPW